MVVCVCNKLTTADIQKAVDNGNITVKDVFLFHQCEVQCGICNQAMEDEIKIAYNDNIGN